MVSKMKPSLNTTPWLLKGRKADVLIGCCVFISAFIACTAKAARYEVWSLVNSWEKRGKGWGQKGDELTLIPERYPENTGHEMRSSSPEVSTAKFERALNRSTKECMCFPKFLLSRNISFWTLLAICSNEVAIVSVLIHLLLSFFVDTIIGTTDSTVSEVSVCWTRVVGSQSANEGSSPLETSAKVRRYKWRRLHGAETCGSVKWNRLETGTKLEVTHWN